MHLKNSTSRALTILSFAGALCYFLFPSPGEEQIAKKLQSGESPFFENEVFFEDTVAYNPQKFTDCYFDPQDSFGVLRCNISAKAYLCSDFERNEQELNINTND